MGRPIVNEIDEKLVGFKIYLEDIERYKGYTALVKITDFEKGI